MLTMREKRALTATIVRRYEKATKKEKTQILNEFVATTSYNRSYARRILNQAKSQDFRFRQKKKRVVVNRKYNQEVARVLTKLWMIENFICSKRLKPFLPELVGVLKRDGELEVSQEVEEKLKTVSAATIDRILVPVKNRLGVRGITTTKPGTLLKSQIPIRTFADWDNLKPGFMEMDTVAFCGGILGGPHVWGLNLIDVATGWEGLEAVMGKNQAGIHQAVARVKNRLPFPLLGLDSDNGTEFINAIMTKFCQTHEITFTRIRPGRKNDNCYVEQKNYTVLRNFVGYGRYNTSQQLVIIRKLLEKVELYVNLFQPSVKLVSKTRLGAKVKKNYDKAQTPYQRLLKSGHLDLESKKKLRLLYQRHNPLQLQKKMNQLRSQLESVNRYKFGEATNDRFRYFLR